MGMVDWAGGVGQRKGQACHLLVGKGKRLVMRTAGGLGDLGSWVW